jgi:hypothetical protein
MGEKLPTPVNPFPIGSRINGEIWGDRRETQSLLKKACEIAFGSAEPMMIQITGDYGSGKTHTLQYLDYQLRQGWDKMYGFPIYIRTPGDDLPEFFYNFFSAAKQENIISSMKQLYGQVLRNRSSEVQKDSSTEEIFSKFDTLSLAADLKQVLVDLFKATGFSLRGTDVTDHWESLATALSYLPLKDDKQNVALRWLTFQRLYQADRAILKFGADNRQTPAYVAATMVAIIRMIARANNYPKVVLLIDELEEIRDSTHLPEIADCFRHLVDSGLPELLIVIGSSGPAEEMFEEANQALVRRIHMTITLHALKPSDVLQLANKYLGLSADSEQWLTAEGAAVFCDATEGRMSDILQLLGRAFDQSRDLREKDPTWKKIGSKQAEMVLSESRKFGFPYSFVEPEATEKSPR